MRKPYPVICIDMRDLRGWRFKSATDAARFLGVSGREVRRYIESGWRLGRRYALRYEPRYTWPVRRDEEGRTI